MATQLPNSHVSAPNNNNNHNNNNNPNDIQSSFDCHPEAVKNQGPTSDSSHSSRTHSRSSSIRRPSFGSIKEDSTGEIAQSFVDTEPRPPSKDQNKELPQVDTTAAQVHTQHSQHSPDFCCPCGAFLGWKQIRLGGRRASRSFSDLRLLGGSQSKGWAWDAAPTNKRPILVVQKEPKKPEKGCAPVELLPAEILDQIISHLALDIPPNGYTPRNIDLVSCLLTSRTLHSATLSVLYRNITIPHSIIFSKALNHIRQYPSLGTIVRRLDFSHFTSVGLGRTQQMNAEIQNLTSKTLSECLDLMPNLKECLLQEHVENDVNAEVTRKLFTRLPYLRALDFCGCSSKAFSQAFLNAITEIPDFPESLPALKRLSLHECTGLPVTAFDALLPRLVNVTHLDLTHTQISTASLFSIPESARITHFNISRCTRLTGPEVVRFLTTHPAVKDSLIYLNVMSDSSRHQILDEENVTDLLPSLGSDLRSLNLGGAKITSVHLPELIGLSKHVEELGLNSANLTVQELNSFFVPPAPTKESEKAGPSARAPWVPSQIKYLDLTKNPHITQAALFNPKVSVLVTPQSYPLDVLELSEKIIIPLRQRSQAKRGPGWVVRDLGRRGWYVREPHTDASGKLLTDDGRRPWKMGAKWWGMRKIPVSVNEVGGLYGHYMFKK
ncbi:hypothetical protein AJ80_07022 [Polytolypa hystricis UAMH7299]|uniref:F-box domain-containing protein n=1 Tax=Polytolypa hystricis (strain UAMH7299) TaxID=1447883 RepID=A0A2B7XRS8_POLH7|nr:hypothetical protein AJ80_07022 [Polytolypa hystricis UAMH7299]